ncbi:MAG: MOSC domain-containing protein [Solirubrobacterales bacterium]|nr:MOSC domain-containing protein [Solirubrobacterales bacterium]
MSITVTGLAITPVKSTRLRGVEQIRLERGGVRENRRFYLIDARDHLLNGKRLGELCALVADYSESSESGRRLRLTFPDGRVLEDEVTPGAEVTTRFFSKTARARLIDGPWSAALSEYARRPVRLVEANGSAVDRLEPGVASLISRASLARLAAEGGERDVDARRFRMLIEVDGVAAHAEDGWVGSRTRIGDAVVGWVGHAGRCLTTSRDPETGVIDLPTLDILRSYRGELETSEPLPFGIYGEVVREGVVRIGDEVEVGPAQ